MAYENSQTGIPLMRPLFFEEPENEVLLTKSDGYLWGNDFLVYPILEAGQKTKEVYFPKGSTWKDYYSGVTYDGGTTHQIPTEQSYIPTFVRVGSIVPLVKRIENTEAFNANKIEYHYYFDENVTEEKEFSFYFDDGKTAQNHEKENFYMMHFEIEKEGKWLEIEIEKEIAKNYIGNKEETITLTIQNLSKKPRKVKFKNTKGSYRYYEKLNYCTFTYLVSEKEVEIKIKL
jgi:alpha-glucosidase (family GH31 glycosyl hydrolase)